MAAGISVSGRRAELIQTQLGMYLRLDYSNAVPVRDAVHSKNLWRDTLLATRWGGKDASAQAKGVNYCLPAVETVLTMKM